MKVLIGIISAAAMVFIGGCFNQPLQVQETQLACLLEVSRSGNDEYAVKTEIYDECQGDLLAKPGIVVPKGQKGFVLLVEDNEKDKSANGKFYSKSVGQIPTDANLGIRTTFLVKEFNKNTVLVSLLILQQKSVNRLIDVNTLDVSSVEVSPGKPVLLLKRAEGVMAIPVRLDSAESVENARRWSPHFRTYKWQ